MRTIGIRIGIRSSPEAVYQVLANEADYPLWHPFQGAPGWFDRLFRPGFRVIREDNHCLRITSSREQPGRFVHVEREITLYTRMDGTTLYLSKVIVTGSLQTFAFGLQGRKLLRRLDQEAAGLKQFCESRFPCTPLAPPAPPGTGVRPAEIQIAQAIQSVHFTPDLPQDGTRITYH